MSFFRIFSIFFQIFFYFFFKKIFPKFFPKIEEKTQKLINLIKQVKYINLILSNV